MKSGAKIQPTNKNSFAASSFDNEFLSELEDSESYRDSSIKQSNKEISNNNSVKIDKLEQNSA
jgi:hypothetical protein